MRTSWKMLVSTLLTIWKPTGRPHIHLAAILLTSFSLAHLQQLLFLLVQVQILIYRYSFYAISSFFPLSTSPSKAQCWSDTRICWIRLTAGDRVSGFSEDSCPFFCIKAKHKHIMVTTAIFTVACVSILTSGMFLMPKAKQTWLKTYCDLKWNT